MKNLAGAEIADEIIKEELGISAIHPVLDLPLIGEVPYSLRGELSNWTFRRAWKYWVASTADGEGIPLEAAELLHEKPYPILNDRGFAGEISIYGHAIRVAGHCGAPAPQKGATHVDADSNILSLDPHLVEKEKYDSFVERSLIAPISNLRFVQTLDEAVTSTVDLYHIDTQEGLNDFARTIISLR